MLSNNPFLFATLYDQEFINRTKNLSHSEIPLFRAMHQTLAALGKNYPSRGFDVEEYHGSAHQVMFTGDDLHARKKARCELSDLMIITFSSLTKSIRLTYLQAKSERTVFSLSEPQFSANLEQWFLLEKRPEIKGVGKFNPPSNLLSSALLPSIGSFAFFYKDALNNFQTYYAAANSLAPLSAKKLQTKFSGYRSCSVVVGTTEYQECLLACCNFCFAHSLFSLEIGTPIDSSIRETLPIRNWLASNLRAKIKSKEKNILAQELLELLAPESDETGSGFLGAKNLILIKSDFNNDGLKLG